MTVREPPSGILLVYLQFSVQEGQNYRNFDRIRIPLQMSDSTIVENLWL